MKKCLKCGSEWPDDADFCGNCGFRFAKKESVEKDSGFSFKMFFTIIAITAVIIAGIFILVSSDEPSDEVVDLTDSKIRLNDNGSLDIVINEVSGYSYDGYDGDESYDLMTSAYFMEVPSDYGKCMIKTLYYENDTVVAQEIESFKEIYGYWEGADYPIAFGSVESHKPLAPDYVVVEVTKKGELIGNFTAYVDKNKIEYLD